MEASFRYEDECDRFSIYLRCRNPATWVAASLGVSSVVDGGDLHDTGTSSRNGAVSFHGDSYTRSIWSCSRNLKRGTNCRRHQHFGQDGDSLGDLVGAKQRVPHCRRIRVPDRRFLDGTWNLFPPSCVPSRAGG